MNSLINLTEQDIEKLKSCVFFVEANSNETFMLWKENKNIFTQDNFGLMITIGHILTRTDESYPVCVSLMFNYVHGSLVCFYDCTSRFCDHTMVESFFKDNFLIKWDKGSRTAMCDAQNFHLCIDHCKHLRNETNNYSHNRRY